MMESGNMVREKYYDGKQDHGRRIILWWKAGKWSEKNIMMESRNMVRYKYYNGQQEKGRK